LNYFTFNQKNSSQLACGVVHWEIGPMAASIAAFFLITFRTFAKGNIVPINDPYLVESLDHH